MHLSPGTTAHIVYRLRDSLPVTELDQLRDYCRQRLHQLQRDFPAPGGTRHGTVARDFTREKRLLEAFEFRQYDGLLDRCVSGPRFLEDPRLKAVVLSSWARVEAKGIVRLHAISVMSNHVHALLTNTGEVPLDVERLMARHKRFTARFVNEVRGDSGRVFAEFNYVRITRPAVFERVVRYVINNPVKVGLTDDPVNWCGNFLRAEYVGLFDRRAA